MRRKLASFLDEDCPDIRVTGPVSVEHDAFFPCDMRIVLSAGRNGWKQGIVAVREQLANSLEEFVARAQVPVLSQTGAAYATGFEFPASFGPDAYLSSVCTVPHRNVTVPVGYEHRLNRWRENVTNKGLRARDGFVREVYPINFLLGSHLSRPLERGTLGDLVVQLALWHTSRSLQE